MAKIHLASYEFYSSTKPAKYTILQYLPHVYVGWVAYGYAIWKNRKK